MFRVRWRNGRLRRAAFGNHEALKAMGIRMAKSRGGRPHASSAATDNAPAADAPPQGKASHHKGGGGSGSPAKGRGNAHDGGSAARSKGNKKEWATQGKAGSWGGKQDRSGRSDRKQLKVKVRTDPETGQEWTFEGYKKAYGYLCSPAELQNYWSRVMHPSKGYGV